MSRSIALLTGTRRTPRLSAGVLRKTWHSEGSVQGLFHRIRNILLFIFISAFVRSPQGLAQTFPAEDSLVARLPALDVATYFELQCLMNPYQMKQYLTLRSHRARDEWVERFWLELDPTPTTEMNERRVEHEKRIAVARELFASQKAPGWDARGEIIIRYGAPDVRMKKQGDVTPERVVPPKEVWSYRRPPIVITFEDINLIGEYVYAPEPESWCTRLPGPNNVPEDIDYTINPGPSAVVSSEDYPLSGVELYQYLEKTPAIYSYDLDHKELPLYFDIVRFQGGDRSLRTEVNFEVPANEVGFAAKGGKRVGEVEFRVVARDINMKKVASGNSVIRPVVADSLPGSMLLPGQVVLPLGPGYYRIGLEAYDWKSGRRAGLRTNLELAPFDTSPAISDIEFSSSIRETEENQRFLKGGLQVVPHPLHSYRIPFPIMFYFEIYGLTTDRDDFAFYKIEYRIDPLQKKRWGPVLQDMPTNISSSFETSGYGSTQAQRLAIATDNLWEGSFKLIVKVTDRRTFKTATKSAKFSILE